MKYPFTLLALLLVGWLCGHANLYAQAEQTPERLVEGDDEPVVEEAPPTEPVDPPDSNVVDVNEEYFRRLMELQDQNLQRSPDLTTGSYSRSTGLQALEGLPEESQKHLREQLREVIVENGPWTPEDAGTEYPYLPSAQAGENRSLARREEAAWGEMVSEYHEREAAIHANAGRTQAATATQGSPGKDSPGKDSPGEGPGGNPGNHEQGDSGEAEQGAEDEAAGEDSQQAQRAAALAEMLNAADAADANSASQQSQAIETGTEQNALELLTSRNQVPAQASQTASSAQSSASASVEITQASSQSSPESGDSRENDPSVNLDSDDVIAIEDLDKVVADPVIDVSGDADDNQPD